MKKIIALIFFLALPSVLSAQAGLGSDLSIRVSPEHPRAGETVSLEAENFNIDLNTATFSWSVNGKVRKEGKGEKRFSFDMGPLGSTLTVSVTATAPDGSSLSKTLVFEPAEVDLLWQTNSYTPPFYRGKALFPFQGTAFVAALPRFTDGSGKKISSRELIYTWKDGDTVMGDDSGLGRNLFIFQGRVPIRSKSISVTVATADGSESASAETTVEPVAPRLLLYQDHPLYGILFADNASDLALEGDEVKIAAVPYYFEVFTRTSPDISYDWSTNFEALPAEKGSSITLRRVSPKGGESSIAVTAQSRKSSFQASQSSATINILDKTAASGLSQ